MCQRTVNLNYPFASFIFKGELRKIIIIKSVYDSSFSLFITYVEGQIDLQLFMAADPPGYTSRASQQ